MGALSFPLPFITALLAGILALRILVTAQGIATARAIFAGLFAAMALKGLMVGLRFGYDIGGAAALQPVLAMLVPPLAWLGFRAMTSSPPAFGRTQVVLHGLPVALAAAEVAALPGREWAWVVDLTVMASYVGYSCLLLALHRRGPAVFSRLDPAVVADARRQLLVFAVLMLASAGVDLWILVGVLASGGEVPLAPIVGGHVLGLAMLVLLLALAPQRMLGTLAAQVLPKRAQSADAEADAALVVRLRDIMATGLYRDPGLDAARLAKRLGVPQRRVSEAVNGRLGLNVSQFVNGCRIDEACRRLEADDTPVTEIMLAVGFETKSNFNREFRRVTGTSPSAWRQARQAVAADEPTAPDGAPPP
jgi:AraC-like DNA-binding protein